MALVLARHGIDVDVYDAEAVRAWLMERLELEVKLKGQAHPRLLLLADGYEESLDLDRLTKQEAGADAGATFQALRARPDIQRRFAVVGMLGESLEGEERSFTVLFEEIDDGDQRRWWLALQQYTLDPTTGLGIPGPWQPSNGETDEVGNLFPFLQELARPPASARAAQVLPPRQEEPDIQVAFGEIRDASQVSDAAKMAELAFQIVGAAMLDGRIKGNVVVRLNERSTEQWVLGEEIPTTLEDMIRYIAMREPRADGVALVQIAIRPQDNPPALGFSIVAERAGHFVEVRAPLGFPDGPAGRKVLGQFLQTGPRPVPAEGMWLGVDPMVSFDLGPMGVNE